MAFPPPADKKPDDKGAPPPFPPKKEGAEPPKDKLDPKDVMAKLDDADAGGALQPIKDALSKLGRDDISAKEVATLAQKDDRTHGKSPEEIAKMIDEDDTLLDDLLEYKDGGSFAQRGMGMKGDDEGAEGEAPMRPGPGATSDEMM